MVVDGHQPRAPEPGDVAEVDGRLAAVAADLDGHAPGPQVLAGRRAQGVGLVVGQEAADVVGDRPHVGRQVELGHGRSSSVVSGGRPSPRNRPFAGVVRLTASTASSTVPAVQVVCSTGQYVWSG